MLSNCGAGEDSWESLGLHGDQTSQSERKSVLNVHWKPQLFSPILWLFDAKSQVIGKDPDGGKIEGRRRRGWQRMRCLDGITNWMNIFEQTLGGAEEQGSLACCGPWGCRVGHDWVTEQQHVGRDWSGGSRVALFLTSSSSSNPLTSGCITAFSASVITTPLLSPISLCLCLQRHCDGIYDLPR